MISFSDGGYQSFGGIRFHCSMSATVKKYVFSLFSGSKDRHSPFFIRATKGLLYQAF